MLNLKSSHRTKVPNAIPPPMETLSAIYTSRIGRFSPISGEIGQYRLRHTPEKCQRTHPTCQDARSQQQCWSNSHVRDHSSTLAGKRNATSRSGAIVKDSKSCWAKRLVDGFDNCILSKGESLSTENSEGTANWLLIYLN